MSTRKPNRPDSGVGQTVGDSIRVKGLDHVVLNVQDANRSLDFYGNALGLGLERVAEWRAGEARFPSDRVNESTIIDLSERPHAATALEAPT